jgi:hypothetical protein
MRHHLVAQRFRAVFDSRAHQGFNSLHPPGESAT